MKQFIEYQQFAEISCLSQCWDMNYLVLGLCGESGEVAEKLKRAIRDKKLDKHEVAKELGDVLWYVTNLARYLGYDLEEIAELNKTKLTKRIKNNTRTGTGDNR